MKLLLNKLSLRKAPEHLKELRLPLLRDQRHRELRVRIFLFQAAGGIQEDWREVAYLGAPAPGKEREDMPGLSEPKSLLAGAMGFSRGISSASVWPMNSALRLNLS